MEGRHTYLQTVKRVVYTRVMSLRWYIPGLCLSGGVYPGYTSQGVYIPGYTSQGVYIPGYIPLRVCICLPGCVYASLGVVCLPVCVSLGVVYLPVCVPGITWRIGPATVGRRLGAPSRRYSQVRLWENIHRFMLSLVQKEQEQGPGAGCWERLRIEG